MPLKNRLAKTAWILILLISACTPTLTPIEISTPRVITVQVTPAMLSLGEQFHLCAEEQTSAGFVLLETPASEISPDENAGIALRWGTMKTPPGFTAQIGVEEISVVVSAGSPLRQISLDDLRDIYQGRLREWKDPAITGEIQPWAYTSGDDVQEVFQMVMLDGASISSRATALAPDPPAMREAVAGSSNAIGFLPSRWVNSTVRALTITGLSADRLQQPILMLSKSEPNDPERSWLLCLQEQLK